MYVAAKTVEEQTTHNPPYMYWMGMYTCVIKNIHMYYHVTLKFVPVTNGDIVALVND